MNEPEKLKSAEEWVNTLGNRIDRQRYASSPLLLKELIKQIQLNAYRAGVRKEREVTEKLYSVLMELKVRIAYIGMPQESMWRPDPNRDYLTPDWRKQCALIEEAQQLFLTLAETITEKEMK